MKTRLLSIASIAILMFLLLAPGAIAHKGEVKYISYDINYTDYAYLDGNNIPVYYIGGTMYFNVMLTNTGSRSFQNIEVIAIQEYYDGTSMLGSTTTIWSPISIKGAGTTTLSRSYVIPRGTTPGLNRTHLIIRHMDGDNIGGEVIIDDPLAGVWCP